MASSKIKEKDNAKEFEPLYQGDRFVLVDRCQNSLSSTIRVRKVRLYLLRNREKLGMCYESPNGVRENEVFIKLVSVTDIRRGCCTDLFNEYITKNKMKMEERRTYAKRSFSIHYGEDLTISLSLTAASETTAEVWTSGLMKLVDSMQVMLRTESIQHDFWIRYYFRSKATELNDGDIYLTKRQCQEILTDLNVVLDKQKLEEYFLKANTSPVLYKGEPVLDENEFLEFFKLISYHPALDEIFYSIADTTVEVDHKTEPAISPQSLLKFLKDVQGLKYADLPYARQLITRHFTLSANGMPLKGFRSIMLSTTFDIRIEEHRKINQPMDRPITEYWQKSSHNTYIVRDQLTGFSTIEGFRYALLHRCACVEIDLWNGKYGEPVVTHGNTLMQKTRARHILENGIKPFAFVHDDLPLILSVEDHLDEQQREIFKKDLEEVFGSRLYRGNIGGDRIPTLKELRGKVLVKQTNLLYGNMANVYRTGKLPAECITKGTPITVNGYVSSISEHQFNKLLGPSPLLGILSCGSNPTEEKEKRFQVYTTYNLLRVYPGWHHQLSGNFNARDAMNVGAQMIAMNVHTKCRFLALYNAYFRSNGDCGFALKPRLLIDSTAPRIGAKRLKLTIISAQHLPSDDNQKSPVVNPLVEVVIDGVKRDRAYKRTKRVNSGGLNPVWNEEMEFLIYCPELAIVLFSVQHVEKRWYALKKKFTIGEFALPLLSIGSGYRHVSLHDSNLEHLPLASVFVKIEVSDLK